MKIKLPNIKVGLIGAGTMGSIFVKRLLESNTIATSQIFINDKFLEKAKALASSHKVKAIDDKQELTEISDILILAVKPQDFKGLTEEIKSNIGKKEILIISIMAGVGVKIIQQLLRCKMVVRAMPNMPSQIDQGITVWLASPEVVQNNKKRVEIILQALGQAIETNQERYLDMATAVSGSGPAYVFLFQELFIKAAKRLGLPRNLADKLVLGTIQGAVDLQRQTQTNPEILRKKVTSKGGTTEQALKVFASRETAKTFQLAVKAAFDKSQALKNNFLPK